MDDTCQYKADWKSSLLFSLIATKDLVTRNSDNGKNSVKIFKTIFRVIYVNKLKILMDVSELNKDDLDSTILGFEDFTGLLT